MDDKSAALAGGMLPAYWAEVAPDRPALYMVSGRITFGELDADVNRLVRALRRRVHRSRSGPEGELIAHCRRHLAHFMCPRTVDITGHPPREDTGKLFNRKLRDEYRATARKQE